MKLAPGARVDRYSLVAPLGQGGQGTVWRATDLLEQEERALKLVVLRDGDGDAADRARREARAVVDLRHPSIVPCFTLFELPAEGLIGLVFELVRGETLARAELRRRLSDEQKEAALTHIATALAHVHAAQIVHRDLKPENIILTDSFWSDPRAPGALKLVDFGISGPSGPSAPSTLAGLFGTPPYMAPELFSAQAWSLHRSPARDVFAFGVVAWELLVGGHPTGLPERAGAGTFAASYEFFMRSRDAWPPRALPGAWGSVAAACLALDPERRPRDGGAIVAALGEGASSIAAGSAGAVPPASLQGASRPTPASHTAEHVAPSRAPIDRPSEVALARPSGAPGSGPSGTLPATPLPASIRTEPAPRASLPSAPRLDRTTPAPVPVIPRAPPASPPRQAAAAPPRGVVAHPAGRTVGAPPGAVNARWVGPMQAAEEPSRSLGWIVALAVFLVLLTAGGLAGLLFLGFGVRFWAPAPSPSATSRPAPPPTALAPSPVASTVPPAAGIAVAACCDREKATCASGRRCETWECSPAPERRWKLRVAGAIEKSGDKGKNIALAYPGSRVCVDTPDSGEKCVVLANPEADERQFPIASTSDLISGQLRLRVLDGARTVYSGHADVVSGGFSTKALCIGLALYIGPKADAKARVTLYLDDP